MTPIDLRKLVNSAERASWALHRLAAAAEALVRGQAAVASPEKPCARCGCTLQKYGSAPGVCLACGLVENHTQETRLAGEEHFDFITCKFGQHVFAVDDEVCRCGSYHATDGGLAKQK